MMAPLTVVDNIVVHNLVRLLYGSFESGELQEEVVSSKMELTTQHGAIDGKTQTRPGGHKGT